MIDQYEQGDALWRDDPRDYQAEHIVGAIDQKQVIPLKKKMKTTPQNQGGTVQCTTYSVGHNCQILDSREHNEEILGAMQVMWDLQGLLGTRVPNGDYIDTALRSVRINGFRSQDGKTYPKTGSARIPMDWQSVIYYLTIDYPLSAISLLTKTNFYNARVKGVWTGKDGNQIGGHAWLMNGFELKLKTDFSGVLTFETLNDAVDVENSFVWALNSYGEDYGKFKDGTFKVPLSEIEDIWSAYIIYDLTDLKMIYKDVSEKSPLADSIKEAKDLGLMQGYEDGNFGPNNPLTRAEASVLMVKLYKKLKAEMAK